jgi:repressor LexA
MDIGKIIRRLREEKKISRQELAEKANISLSGLYFYEKGEKIPSAEILLKLALALEVSSDKLLGIEKNIVKSPEDLMLKIKHIPLFDKISSNFKVEENVLNYVSVTEFYDADFALKINDDSTSPSLIEGNIALVKKQNFLENGDVGVISYNKKEAFIKRYLILNKTETQLISLNTKYPTIFFTEKDLKKIVIYGKVVGKISKFEIID